MDEDDTFQRLKQVPFCKLRGIIDALPYDEWIKLQDEKIRDAFLKTQGWTYEELRSKYAKAFPKDEELPP